MIFAKKEVDATFFKVFFSVFPQSLFGLKSISKACFSKKKRFSIKCEFLLKLQFKDESLESDSLLGM